MPISTETTNEPVTGQYSITRLSSQNLRDLDLLYEAVYGRMPEENYFEKKYNTEYTGVSHVGYIAYHHQQPIAYYGVIPCFIQYKNEQLLAAQSADTMTHPGFRMKGMFVTLSQQTFELCRTLGIRLIFGFPNQNSYHGAVNKLGWKPGAQMICFTIPVKTFPLYRLCQKLKSLKKIYSAYGHAVLKKYLRPSARVTNSVTADGFAGVWRNESYHQTKSQGSIVIEKKGMLVWLRIKEAMLIGDMEGVNEGNFSSMISFLKKLCAVLGVQQIQFHGSPGTNLTKLFEDRFSSSPSYPVLFQNFGSPIPIDDIRFHFADIDIF
ncbi:MAG: GNAT family N-acetyltransferase [Flavisolibacter sp.]